MKMKNDPQEILTWIKCFIVGKDYLNKTQIGLIEEQMKCHDYNPIKKDPTDSELLIGKPLTPYPWHLVEGVKKGEL